ncbi:17468_t:CDS:2 [Dentiscutata erythropus]|uniref:17468_t:CDS:1 n=1 Tax=Dentiscutata erythropus TaxID=1348616 RepID=A0A9N9FV18_9GLOM|nr:17468_t:CDS:2 [Dentiscutata erythropus]
MSFDCRYKVDSKAYKNYCYKKRIIKSNNKIKDDEFYNYILIKILNIPQNNSPNVDEFQILNLTDIQKQQLQELRAEQMRRVIRFNEIKNGIENETLENIERLPRLKFWTEYLAEYNLFVKQIQNETDLYRLREFWITKINNSQFTNEEKLNLHKIHEECIRILLEQSQQSNYQRIQNGILKETNITNLEVDRYWFREINRSSLSENQQKELNDLHAKTLIALSNKQYNEIRKEILKTNDSFLLEDRGDIDRQIQLLKDNNLTDERQTIKLQEMRRGRLQNLLQVKEIANYD